MTIQLHQLTQALTTLTEDLRQRGHLTVELTDDYYWNVPTEQKYDVDNEPNDFTIGQLSENQEHLKRLLEGSHSPLMTDFKWLGELLTAIGEQVKEIDVI